MNRPCALLSAAAIAVAACSPPAPPPSEDVVLDLVGDFPLSSTRIDSTLPLDLIDADGAAAGFAMRDGSLVGLGDSSWADFDMVAPRNRTLTLHFDPMGWFRQRSGEVQVALNGIELVTLRRADMNAAHTIELPAEFVSSGTNRLEFRYHVADGADFGADAARPRGVFLALELDMPPTVEPAAIVDSGGLSALRIPAGTRQEYAAMLPAGAELRLTGVRPFGEEAGARLEVEIAQDGAPPVRTMFEMTDSEQTFAVPYAGATRISLVVSPAAAGGVELGSAHVVRPGPQSVPTSDYVPTEPPTHVIIYLIDTLRADRLGVYGHDQPTSPNIDAFAQDAIVFDNAQAQSSWTKPTVASMITGLLPQTHGVQGREDHLAPDARTLAAIFQAAGYVTYAVNTNSTVFSDFNFDSGYHEFIELGERPTDETHQLSDVVNEEFFALLERRPTGRPLFAWLHTTDPHEPYFPRQPYRDQFAADVLDPEIIKGPAARRALEADPTLDRDRVRRDMENLYDAEIAFNDAQFGLLVDRLKSEGLYDSSMIVVLSDHGDEFLEHGGWSHGGTLFQEVLHVPLIVKLPRQVGAGTRVRERAQHVDLFPTVMEVAGLEFDSGGPGQSLLTLDRNELGSRPILSHLTLTPALRESVLAGNRKLLRLVPPGDLARTQMFDLAIDPAERGSVALPITQDAFLDLLRRAAIGADPGAGGQLILDPEMTEQLRALGYIQ